MQKIKIAKRYAKSFLDYCFCSGELDKVYEEMQQILNLIYQNHELYLFLQTSLIDSKKKKMILFRLFGSFSKTILNFLKLINLHKRTSLLRVIIFSFLELYKEKKQWIDITLITAISLNEKIENLILDKLLQKKGINKKYFFFKKKDPTLIGGFILRIKDKEWDMSLISKVQRLRQSFTNQRYIKNIEI